MKTGGARTPTRTSPGAASPRRAPSYEASPQSWLCPGDLRRNALAFALVTHIFNKLTIQFPSRFERRRIEPVRDADGPRARKHRRIIDGRLIRHVSGVDVRHALGQMRVR